MILQMHLKKNKENNKMKTTDIKFKTLTQSDVQYYIHIIITIIFSLLFPHYYHCPYYPTTITHYWHHADNHKNDSNNNESDSNDDLKNKSVKK